MLGGESSLFAVSTKTEEKRLMTQSCYDTMTSVQLKTDVICIDMSAPTHYLEYDIQISIGMVEMFCYFNEEMEWQLVTPSLDGEMKKKTNAKATDTCLSWNARKRGS